MKLPNGFGSVYKMGGKRRKPWAIVKNGRYIGYAKTKEEALNFLTDYNKDPMSNEITHSFEEIFNIFLEYKKSKYAINTIRRFEVSYRTFCEPLYNKIFEKLRLKDYLQVLEKAKASNAQKNNLIKLFKALDKTAYELEFIDRRYADTITYYDKAPIRPTNPFTEEEIAKLWANKTAEDVDLILILLYTGLRSGELGDLKIKNIGPQFLQAGNKTKAGKDRLIPIHPGIKDFIQERVKQATGSTLLNYTTKRFRIRFNNTLQNLGMRKHHPHECRHTFITRLDNAGANKVCIDLIVGHASGTVGERTYTHKTKQQLIETVNLLT